MAVKRKTGGATKAAHKTKSSAKAAQKTGARKAAPKAKHPAAKHKAGRKPKPRSTIEKAEAAVVEMAKGARSVIRSVTKSISGKKK
jgi:hypothetical protein